jgi:hypothetical protein
LAAASAAVITANKKFSTDFKQNWTHFLFHKFPFWNRIKCIILHLYTHISIGVNNELSPYLLRGQLNRCLGPY